MHREAIKIDSSNTMGRRDLELEALDICKFESIVSSKVKTKVVDE